MALVCASNGTAFAQTSAPAVASPRAAAHAVGVTTDTFVDTHRSTPAHAGTPELPTRTLPTTIWYPAQGDPSSTTSVPDAPADPSGGPYPLIVFGHGNGGTPQYYDALFTGWAAAGYVVAAPLFPLTNAGTPGGTVPDDVFSQPGDVSYVITSLLAASDQSAGAFAHLVDPHAIGVSGHSEGAITTLGFWNTCCRDPRVKAAAVLNGVPQRYAKGRYDYRGAPAMLIVHGTDDELLPYNQMVEVFNQAKAPKALVTLEGAGHADWVQPSSRWFPSAVKVTTDFWDAYVRGSKTAKARIADDGQPSVATVVFAPKPGSTTTASTLPVAKTNRKATVTPRKNLTNGQTVTVTWSGYLPGKVVNVVQCSSLSQAGCDIARGEILHPDPDGKGSLTLQIFEGPIGDGVCNASHKCQVAVNDSGLVNDRAATIRIPISFAP
jgi:dienelactone hydrolase